MTPLKDMTLTELIESVLALHFMVGSANPATIDERTELDAACLLYAESRAELEARYKDIRNNTIQDCQNAIISINTISANSTRIVVRELDKLMKP